MSDIPTTHTLPEDALRLMRTAFRMDPRSARCLEDAEAEITRLRADLAAAQEREQRMREATTCAAVEEYLLQHPNEGPDERLSRAAAARGMMVRLGLYAEFEQRLDYAVLHSPFRAALGEPNE